MMPFCLRGALKLSERKAAPLLSLPTAFLFIERISETLLYILLCVCCIPRVHRYTLTAESFRAAEETVTGFWYPSVCGGGLVDPTVEAVIWLQAVGGRR